MRQVIPQVKYTTFKGRVVMEIQPSYYGFITAEVRYDADLTGDEKILYAEITALSNKHGYCYASNDYFAKLFSVTNVTVSRRINKLKDKGYLKIIYKRSGTVVTNRKVYPLTQTITAVNNPDNGPLTDEATAVNRTVKENTITNNTITKNNITLTEHECFEDWWNLYDKKKARPAAVKAFNKAIENYSYETIETGTKDFLKTVTSKQYQPYPATFLNQERFLDEIDDTDKKADSGNTSEGLDYLDGM